MTRSFAAAGLCAALATGLLTACTPAPPLTPDQRADRATEADCSKRYDEQYAQQNRGAIYTSDDQTNTPNSSTYVEGITSRGLATEYGRNNEISDCVHHRGDLAPSSDAAPAPLTPGPP